MPVRIQFRRGTASEWTSANPTLSAGEMGLETDTLKFKIGDGTTAWTSLAYATQGEGVPVGGTTGQVLAKASNTSLDTEWIDAGAGDMAKATYDPTNVNGDAFDTDNHVDGTTNKVYTATEKTKLAGIEASADVTDAGNVGSSIFGATAKTTPVDADTVGLTDSVASNVLKKLTWANIKATLKTYFDTLYATVTHTHTESDITDLAHYDSTDFATDLATKTLDDITAGTTNKHFTATDESKLDGIEAGADITDTANVTSAGALMDSEVDADIKTLSLPANTTISAFGATLVDDADAGTARATLGTLQADGPAKLTVSATEPTSPSTNDLWVDTA